jgi:hypothetical protein
MGWFYEFKLHLVTHYRGELVGTKLTTGNAHDIKPVLDITEKLSSKLYVDKGYISKELSEKLKDDGVDLITTVRRNMKTKALPLWSRATLLGALLLKRSMSIK